MFIVRYLKKEAKKKYYMLSMTAQVYLKSASLIKKVTYLDDK